MIILKMNIHFYIKLAECLIPRRLLCKLPHTTMHACPPSTQPHPNLADNLQISHNEKGYSWLFFFDFSFFWGEKWEKSHEKFKTTEKFRSPCSAPRWSSLSKLPLKHGENIVGKFTNASKIVFLWCFTADFWQFYCTTFEIWLLGGQMTCHQFEALKGFAWNFQIS